MRIKTGPLRRRRHKKVLASTRGFRMTKNRLFQVAQEAALHAGQYAYVGRRLRKRNLRSLWITRLNAAVREAGLSYSQFIHLMHGKKIEIDRKILAELAVNHQNIFKSIINQVKN